MGRWGDAFHALIQARDTAETLLASTDVVENRRGTECAGAV